MTNIISDYKAIKNNIPSLIEVSGYRNDFIAKKISMTPAYFSVKKQRGNWSDTDVEKILNAITSGKDEVEDYLLLLIAKSRKGEPTVTLEFEKEYATWK